MKRKASSMLLIAVFLAVLFCPHILWRFFSSQFSGENTEKRTLASRPAFSLKEMDAFPKAYEEYYNDHLPFRDWLIKLYNSLQYYVFQTSSHENVIVGKDGWLFYQSPTDGTTMECYTGSALFSDEELEWIAYNLTNIRDRLAEQGIEFVVFIAPNKERFYSEYMPDHYGEQAQECMLNQALSYLSEHTDIRVVWPYEEMLAYKEANPQQLLYYKTDSHWNEIGGYIGAKALLEELGMQIPPLEQFTITPTEDGSGDLANMLNVIGLVEEGFVSQVRRNFDKESQVQTADGGDGARAPVQKLLMRRDSFGAAMNPYLGFNLSHYTGKHYSEFQPEQIWEKKPDVFVIQIVERYIRWLRNPLF